ncbi:MAG: glycosyl hydrolase family 28-related protein, partial [Bryobacterales bacterium]|nr:glycosyl hydrolase family 28-related protein [Bryobacterales bacterium]
MRPGVFCSVLLFPLCALAAAPYDVRGYGAKGDGATKDTAAIQSAIDAAARQGGGTVFVPPGNYLCGTLHLRSNITLELSAGATLTASRDRKDFAEYESLPFKPVDD